MSLSITPFHNCIPELFWFYLYFTAKASGTSIENAAFVSLHLL